MFTSSTVLSESAEQPVILFVDEHNDRDRNRLIGKGIIESEKYGRDSGKLSDADLKYFGFIADRLFD